MTNGDGIFNFAKSPPKLISNLHNVRKVCSTLSKFKAVSELQDNCRKGKYCFHVFIHFFVYGCFYVHMRVCGCLHVSVCPKESILFCLCIHLLLLFFIAISYKLEILMKNKIVWVFLFNSLFSQKVAVRS